MLRCLMKRPFIATLSLLLAGLFSLVVAGRSYAQEPVTNLQLLIVEFWPDFDRPEVLILLTGTLPAGTSFPAEVTVPLPADATLNVVARINEQEGMVDDVPFQVGEDSVTFVTPDPRFRVEYYVPYQAEGEQRAYEFEWLADLDVAQLAAAVQQPAMATEMNVTPEAASVLADRGDGLTYHTLAGQAVPAGQPFRVGFQYTMAEPQLSVNVGRSPAVESGGETAVSPLAASVTPVINWPLILGGAGLLLIAVALVWLVSMNWPTSRSKVRKPRPRRGTSGKTSGSRARFCHICGQQADPDDRFCRNCGTQLKELK